MTAGLLRRAAREMRVQHGPEHVRHEFWKANADWLDRVATALETGDAEDVLSLGEPSDARTVARAYLGESA